jgi:DNA-binding GntR family transcriptional regulator
LDINIRNALAELIVRGEFRPGDRLEEQALADRFAVSRTPIREAIQSLSSTGLVQLRPRRSAIVRRMNEAELGEAFEAMGEIEGLCASYAAQRLTEAQRLRLKALMEISRTATQSGNAPEAQEIDNEFHGLIHSGARNWMITSLARETRLKVSPYSAIGFHYSSDRLDLGVPHRQHSLIAEAVLDGNAAEARRHMIEHVASNYLTLRNLLAGAHSRDGVPLLAGRDGDHA